MAKEPEGSIATSIAAYESSPHPTFLEKLAPCIVQYRILRGLSQAALSKEACVAKSTLNLLESGKAKDVKLSTVNRICHTLGVSMDALLGRNAVGLVRSPELRGPQGTDHTSTDHGSAYICTRCRSAIPARGLHFAADCMLAMSWHGASNAQIGAELGLSTSVVALALREVHETRRRAGAT